MINDTMKTIGCDVSDKRCEICVLDTDGKIEWRGRIPTTQKALAVFFFQSQAHVVIEVGPHSRWLSKFIEGQGHHVTVANPRQVRLIGKNMSKNDRRDAEMLARLGRADVSLLSPIQHRGEQAQADLAVMKARRALVECRTKLVNLIRSMAKSVGHVLPSCDAECFHRKMAGVIPDELKPALDPIIDTLGALEAQIKTYDRTLKTIAKTYPEVEVVGQPDGVGLLTALVFLLVIDDKHRFAKSRTVGAYVGLRPQQSQSGEVDKQLGITKAGDPFLRQHLVNAANYILGPFGKDSDLRRWGLKLASRGGKNARRRAKVAVARKLAVLMHRLWVTGEHYEPLRQASHEAA